MRTAIIAAGLAAAAAVGLVAPAEAQPYRRYGYHHHSYRSFGHRYGRYGYRYRHGAYSHRHAFHHRY